MTIQWYEFPQLSAADFIAYIICDTTAELPTTVIPPILHELKEGSMAYVKQDGSFYIWNNVSWHRGFKAKS